MGQTRSSGRLCRGGGVSNLAVSASLSPRSTSTTQRRLASALPITACGLRLEDEAVLMAVALRLGSELGSTHTCHCGSLVDATGTRGLICKQAPSRVVRHHALNDCIGRAFGTAGIPVRKEPAGLVQKDGKRPDGCTLIPWRGGRPLAWDVTVAASYVKPSLLKMKSTRCQSSLVLLHASPPMAVRRWQKPRRIYVRSRTGPQSAQLWWPTVAKLHAASVPEA